MTPLEIVEELLLIQEQLDAEHKTLQSRVISRAIVCIADLVEVIHDQNGEIEHLYEE